MNLALGKSPAMSSGTGISKTVDGILAAAPDTCPETTHEENAWWTLSLAVICRFFSVAIKVYDHVPSNVDIIIRFPISLDKNYPTCVMGGRFTKANEYKIFPCPPDTEGDVIWIATNNSFLQLCEVEVFGYEQR